MDPMMERSDPGDRRSVTALISNRGAETPAQPGTRAPSTNAFAGAQPMPSPLAIEAFRTLALTIERTSPDKPIRSIAVLSAWPREGRSFTAQMLARALSELRTPVRLLEVVQGDTAPPTRSGLRGVWDRVRSRPAPPDIVLDDYADASDLAVPDAGVPFSRMRLRPDSFANRTRVPAGDSVAARGRNGYDRHRRAAVQHKQSQLLRRLLGPRRDLRRSTERRHLDGAYRHPQPARRPRRAAARCRRERRLMC